MTSKKFHFDPNLGFLISVIISAILAGGGPTRLYVHSETEQVASKYKMRGVVVPPPVGHVSSLGHSSRTAIGHLYGTAIGLSYRTAIGHSYWTAIGHSHKAAFAEEEPRLSIAVILITFVVIWRIVALLIRKCSALYSITIHVNDVHSITLDSTAYTPCPSGSS